MGHWGTEGAGTGIGLGVTADKASESVVVAYRVAFGRELWRHSLGQEEIAALVVAAGQAYAAGQSKLYIIDSGSELRTMPLGPAEGRMPPGFAVSSQVTYNLLLFTIGPTLYAVHDRTGEVLWSFESKGADLIPPLIMDHFVYTADRDGTLYALEERSVEADRQGPVFEDFFGLTWHAAPVVASGYDLRLIFGEDQTLEFIDRERSFGAKPSGQTTTSATGTWTREGDYVVFVIGRQHSVVTPVFYDTSFGLYAVEVDGVTYWNIDYVDSP